MYLNYMKEIIVTFFKMTEKYSTLQSLESEEGGKWGLNVL